MKNLLLLLVISGICFFTTPIYAQATDAGQIENVSQETVQKQNVFVKAWDFLKDKASDGVVALVFSFLTGYLTKHGVTLIIKKIANKGKVILKEGGEFLLSSSNFLNTLDQQIKDNGDLQENTLKELIEAGKPVLAEGKDVIISIRPKK